MKKQFKRNVEKINEVFKYSMQTYQNDVHVIQECTQLYSDF